MENNLIVSIFDRIEFFRIAKLQLPPILNEFITGD